MGTKPRGNRNNQAGLKMSVSKIRAHMRNGNYSSRISGNTDVFTAAVIEYIINEILLNGIEFACEKTIGKNKGKSLNARALFMGLKKDKDLAAFFEKRYFRSGGFDVEINPALIPEKSRKRAHAARAKKESKTVSVEAPVNPPKEEEASPQKKAVPQKKKPVGKKVGKDKTGVKEAKPPRKPVANGKKATKEKGEEDFNDFN